METATAEALTGVQCITCQAQLDALTFDQWPLAARDHARQHPGHVTELRYVRAVRQWTGDADA